MKAKLISLSIIYFLSFALVHANCESHFVNPFTDICWDCLFPLSIGSVTVVASDYHDTKNPSLPIEICPVNGSLPRIGLNIGFWEPFAMVDVTPIPYCMVSMGFALDVGNAGKGGRQVRDPDDAAGFYYVHWYKYPLVNLPFLVLPKRRISCCTFC